MLTDYDKLEIQRVVKAVLPDGCLMFTALLILLFGLHSCSVLKKFEET